LCTKSTSKSLFLSLSLPLPLSSSSSLFLFLSLPLSFVIRPGQYRTVSKEPWPGRRRWIREKLYYYHMTQQNEIRGGEIKEAAIH
jgi:hypothetical protein